MNVPDAAYSTVHDYKGGSESLAPRMGMSAAVLRNKVNVNTATHHLTLAEAVRMVDLTADDRILHAWAMHRGAVLVTLPLNEIVSDQAVMEHMAATWKTHGEIGTQISQALEDGRMDTRELRRVSDAIFDHARALFDLHARLASITEGDRAG